MSSQFLWMLDDKTYVAANGKPVIDCDPVYYDFSVNITRNLYIMWENDDDLLDIECTWPSTPFTEISFDVCQHSGKILRFSGDNFAINKNIKTAFSHGYLDVDNANKVVSGFSSVSFSCSSVPSSETFVDCILHSNIPWLVPACATNVSIVDELEVSVINTSNKPVFVSGPVGFSVDSGVSATGYAIDNSTIPPPYDETAFSFHSPSVL